MVQTAKEVERQQRLGPFLRSPQADGVIGIIKRWNKTKYTKVLQVNVQGQWKIVSFLSIEAVPGEYNYYTCYELVQARGNIRE